MDSRHKNVRGGARTGLNVPKRFWFSLFRASIEKFERLSPTLPESSSIPVCDVRINRTYTHGLPPDRHWPSALAAFNFWSSLVTSDYRPFPLSGPHDLREHPNGSKVDISISSWFHQSTAISNGLQPMTGGNHNHAQD